MNTRILSTSPLVGQAMQELGQALPELCIAPYRSDRWQTELAHAEALVVLLSEPILESDLDRATKLKVIGTYSVGVNHLPQKQCQERGITIVNTPGVLTEATADLALTLLLAVSRRVAEGEALVRSGAWTGWAPDQLLGISLGGKTCGIMGSGAIGKAFARRVWALGMKPIFWDRDGNKRPVDFGPAIAERMPLQELLEHAAVLSLHCPLTDATRGILDRKMIGLLSPGSIIINTARGGVMDESAVLDGLASGHLGGVGLDVYEGEPLVNSRWLAAPNAVLLPHLGSATVETREAMARLLCEGITRVLGTHRA